MNILKDKRRTVIFASILVLFVVLHSFGLSFPYHQDEYKWVLYSHPEITPPGEVPHPPLTEFIYTRLGPLIGDSHFRFIPFSFGIFNFFLLFYLVKYLYDRKAAKIAVLIFTISFYSLLASLMIDVDGAVMPFFLLLLSIGYFKWRNANFTFDKINWKWVLLLLVGGIGGFMIKLSALLPLCAFALDFALEKNVFSDKKRLVKYVLGILLSMLGLALILIGSKFVFPFFKLEYSMKYWEHFANSSSFISRGWLQTSIQCIKALFYTSPFLFFIPFLLKKEDLKKLRPFLIFLILSFIFYIVLFDFSIGALDRYWQLLVIPVSIFASVVISSMLEIKDNRTKEFLFFGIAISLVLIILQSLPHYVPPLHPKTEWISRILSLKWNFLYPFSGGSGPLGFYVSFLFMALSWVISFVAIIFAKLKPEYRKLVLVFMIPLGVAYNGVFIEEYLFGFWNGSAPRLLIPAVEFIKNNPDIKMVTVYNDNGGNEIQTIGKYRKRLYVDPKFDINEKVATLNKYKEHYFVLDVPRIDPTTIYQKYFDSCEIIYEKTDKKISAKVYDCSKAPDLKI